MTPIDDIVAEDLKPGDVFYVKVNKTFYFLQVIHAAETQDQLNRFGYFVVFFEKTFRKLPESAKELDLQRIYKPKYIWKKTILFAGIWNSEPNIKFRTDLMYQEMKSKYKLIFFDNLKVSSSFNPEISEDFSYNVQCRTNDEGIDITYNHLAWQVILWGLEQEEKGKTKKRSSTIPIYFKDWLEYVEPENIVKTEKTISTFEQGTDQTGATKELKKCVLAINKIDGKQSFISTIEAEAIIDKLIEIASGRGLNEAEAEKVIELHREW
ncbi:hypothetical protein [Pedobacter cryoconitis]|uniref:Uncharacterized protein n=1 Tax=Pedobacter cryoconitis TaxID=188932 RepID=A0A7X0IZ83_9SPHI|nr:hypothetical protein [Pedobacter cryoconitis]MBB6497985.1 hypothetical protein [Pedobacter cryoconitis]